MSRRHKPPSRKPGTTATDAVKAHVIKILRGYAAYNADIMAKVQEIEAAGGRVIDGGQTGPFDDNDRCPWDIKDWRTGELLASGHGAHEDYERAALAIPGPEIWTIEAVREEVGDNHQTPPTEGVPPGLARALEEWLDAYKPDCDEIAAFVGWTAEQVAGCFDREGEV